MPFSVEQFKTSSEDGHICTLLEEVSYTRPSTGEVIVMPVGTVSDGASTPREIWDLIPPFGSYWRATYLHDYLYRLTKRDRKECDDILLEAMKDIGVPLLLRDAIYEGVRLGGSWAFDDDRKAKLRAALKLGLI